MPHYSQDLEGRVERKQDALLSEAGRGGRDVWGLIPRHPESSGDLFISTHSSQGTLLSSYDGVVD